MRVIVTGGAGFLGSHLCERLLRDGNEVICIDNLLTGNTDNISHLMKEGLVFVRYDVTNYLFVDGPVDAVLHFASPASPIDYIRYPIQTLKVGSLGTHKALGLAKSKGAKFLLASTSEVYGDPLVHPQKEDYWGNVNPIGPRGVYDEAKRFAEALVMAYHRYHGLDTRIVRIFNTYGPRMHPFDGRVISNFIRQALCGEPITIFGDGSQTRSFCYRDDMVEGMIRMMDAADELTGPINLGNPDEFTIRELAELVIKLTSSRSKLAHQPLPADDPKQRRPDITLAMRRLDWRPTVPLREGLQKTIEWFRSIDMRHYRPPTPNY